MDRAADGKFHPVGWPLFFLVAGCALYAFGVYLMVLRGFWLILWTAMIALLLYRTVLRMCWSLSIEEDQIRWRTALGSGECDVTATVSVRRGQGRDFMYLRVLDLADGERVHVGAGDEFDRFLALLRDHDPDLQVGPGV